MELLGPKFPNIAQENGRLYVASTHTDFGEDLVYVDGKSWRPWDARRSKVGAAVAKRASQLGIKEGDTVLYLGAAHGYTPTFIADIVGERGLVFCLDFSATVVRDLLRKSRARANMIPILADAKKPETWAYRVTGADAIIMDIAQRDQGAIFLRACERFLKPGGFGILALKARSVDMTRDPKDIFRDTYRMLEQVVKVVDYRELTPLERDHAVFIIKNEVPVPGTPSAFPEKSTRDDAGSRDRGSYDRGSRAPASNAQAERPRWQPRAQGNYARDDRAPASGARDSYVARRDSYSAPRPYGESKYGTPRSGASDAPRSDRPMYPRADSRPAPYGRQPYARDNYSRDAPRDARPDQDRARTDDRPPQSNRNAKLRWGGKR